MTEHIYQPAAVVYSARFWKKIKPEQQVLLGKGNLMAPPARAAVRALGGELIEVLKSLGITVYELTDAERNSFKSSVAGIQAEIVKELGGESQKIYDLLLKGKEEYKKKK